MLENLVSQTKSGKVLELKAQAMTHFTEVRRLQERLRTQMEDRQTQVEGLHSSHKQV